VRGKQKNLAKLKSIIETRTTDIQKSSSRRKKEISKRFGGMKNVSYLCSEIRQQQETQRAL
jgi:hypothetical protein